MTEHEELELLKKQYAAVKKQRDDLRFALADLADSIHSGAYNGFDLNDDKIIDKDGNKVDMFHGGLDAYTKALHNTHYFHIARLLEKMKEYELMLGQQTTRAEIEVLLENWKLPEAIEKYRHWREDDTPDKPLDESTKQERLKKLATLLIIFANDFEFGHTYPSADNGVYSDAFANIVRNAMDLAGIPKTPDGIEAAIKEVYGEEVKMELDKRSPSKKI